MGHALALASGQGNVEDLSLLLGTGITQQRGLFQQTLRASISSRHPFNIHPERQFHSENNFLLGRISYSFSLRTSLFKCKITIPMVLCTDRMISEYNNLNSLLGVSYNLKLPNMKTSRF